MPLAIRSVTPRGGVPLALNHFSVLVGPNNCGKSQTLRDIRDFARSGSTSRLTIFSDVDVALPTQEEVREQVQIVPNLQAVGSVRALGVSSDLQNRHEFGSGENWLAETFATMQNPESQRHLLSNMGTFLIAHLDAEGRFRLAAPSESYDTRSEAPSNAMQAFFNEGEPALKPLRKAFREAFGIDIALDWAAMRRLYLKVGADFGEIPDGRIELDALLRDAAELSQQGDGYKSFAGVAMTALCTKPSLTLSCGTTAARKSFSSIATERTLQRLPSNC